MGDAATFIPVAHAGHWILYMGPVLVVGAAVLVSAVRERRMRDAAGERRPRENAGERPPPDEEP